MSEAVRCKMNVAEITLYQEPKGTGYVKMRAVYASQSGVDGNACTENHIFGKYTPSAEFGLSIQNPTAFDFFKKAFEDKTPLYCDFTIAPN